MQSSLTKLKYKLHYVTFKKKDKLCFVWWPSGDFLILKIAL